MGMFTHRKISWHREIDMVPKIKNADEFAGFQNIIHR